MEFDAENLDENEWEGQSDLDEDEYAFHDECDEYEDEDEAYSSCGQ